jgi:hypothetical protein
VQAGDIVVGDDEDAVAAGLEMRAHQRAGAGDQPLANEDVIAPLAQLDPDCLGHRCFLIGRLNQASRAAMQGSVCR